MNSWEGNGWMMELLTTYGEGWGAQGAVKWSIFTLARSDTPNWLGLYFLL